MNRMMAATISAGATTFAPYGTALPPNLALTMPPPTATSTRKKVPSTSENRRRPSYLSFQKSNWLATEFGCPIERRATSAWRAACCCCCPFGSIGGATPPGWLVICHPPRPPSAAHAAAARPDHRHGHADPTAAASPRGNEPASDKPRQKLTTAPFPDAITTRGGTADR